MEKISNEIPNEPLKADSSFYIERPPIEIKAYQEITKEGCIIRIKSPQKMGKTSLVLRLMKYALQIGYHHIYFDFQQADENIFTDYDKFLRWFCANISKQLQLESFVNDYWDTDIGSNVNCTLYFKHYLLPKINTPLVLVINELNRIFEYPTIASDFLKLLRSWHENAKYNGILQKLRMVLVYSTEVYISLNINQSPFNVGLTIELPNFTIEQIQQLAIRHELDWMGKTGRRYAFELKSLLGGHPYLVRIFLNHLINNENSKFEQIFAEASTIKGIYSSYLRSLLVTVIEHPELASAVKELIHAGEKITLNHIVAYKLQSLGIVKLDGLQCTFSCELYRKYFTTQDFEQLSIWQFMKKLQRENKNLKYLNNIDNLTKLYNERYFDTQLHDLWWKLVSEQAPMSMIILDIDHLKIYNHSHGREAGDETLKKVANVIKEVASNFDGSYRIIYARHNGGEFTILAPGRTVDFTLQLGESIRNSVENLAIGHKNNVFGLAASVITVSLGVVCTVPTEEKSPSTLIEVARQSLNESKNNGRNCISVNIY